MSRYRIKAKSSLFDWIVVQEKKWYGWHTVANFLPEHRGIQRAKELVNDLESLES